MTMSYIQALSGFRNEVKRKFPPQLGSNHRACQKLTRSGKDEVEVILVETMPGPMGGEAEVEEED